MMNKYYTPKIEEFRIGFEYELLAKESRYNKHWRFNTVVNIWLHKTFTKSNFEHGKGWDRFQDLDEEWIRVKYLDKQDMESLNAGLINSINDYEINLQIIKNDYEFFELDYDIDDCRLVVERFTQSSMVAKPTGVYNSHTIFIGTIKNLSELKVLLTQLGFKY